MIKRQDLLDKYFEYITEVIEKKPDNVINEVRCYTIPFFVKAEINPTTLHEIAFTMILHINKLNNDPKFVKYFIPILEEVFRCVEVFLQNKSDDFKNQIIQTNYLSQSKVTDALAVTLNSRSRKLLPVIQILFKLNKDNENSDMAKTLKSLLNQMVEKSPALVIYWIHALDLLNFKRIIFQNLFASVIVKEQDLKSLINKDVFFAQRAAEILDKTLMPNLDQRNPENKFLIKIMGSRSKIAIIRKAFQIVNDFGLKPEIFCPNAVRKRRIANFLFNLKATSNDERLEFSYNFTDMIDIMKLEKFDVVGALIRIERNHPLSGISIAKMYGLDDSDLKKIQPDYMIPSNEDLIKKKMEKLRLHLNDEIYVEEILLEKDYKILLIDTLQKLCFTTAKLHDCETIGFDIEAGLVCQDSDGVQKACLIQIAFEDSTHIVDLHKLVQEGGSLIVQPFFEAFFKRDIERIGFDVQNDFNFLLNTFEWMQALVNNLQPVFYCLHKFAKIVYGSMTYKDVFSQLSSPSLAEVASCWLNIELPKAERHGNWHKRPLSKEKLVYAATDAKTTKEAFSFVREKLEKSGLILDLNELLLVTTSALLKHHGTNERQKESTEEIVSAVSQRLHLIRKSNERFIDPKEVTIIVDSCFLYISRVLRLFGFNTFDERNVSSKSTRKEFVEAVHDLTKNSGVETEYFLLTNVESNSRFVYKASFDQSKIINCEREEMKSCIVATIFTLTKTHFDKSHVLSRCPKCENRDLTFKIPPYLVRFVIIHFSKCKKFFEKLEIDDNSAELLDELKNDIFIKCDNHCVTVTLDIKISLSFYLEEKSVMIEFRDERGDNDEKPYLKREMKIFNKKVFEKSNSDYYFCVTCMEFF